MPLPLLRLNGAAGSLRCRGRLAVAPLATRRSLASAAAPRRVCVVGSGPAGMYAASALLRAAPDVHVDVVERLCTPFGLIRFGVAPDHPEMKVMAEKFDAVAADERVRLIGNVEVGRDVSVAQLRRFYDGLIFAFGADGDRSIGLEGEHEIDGIHAARDFVAWYNGLPSHRSLDFKLDEVESVVVVGNGNVATDVARILLMPTTMLARTDITAHALDALERSTVSQSASTPRHAMPRRDHLNL
jgi:adrenodoxin-NADP+ reductase